MKKAEDANQKALAIFQSIKNKRGEAIMLGNLGGLEYMYGNLAKSEALTRRSFELFREMEDAGHIVEGADNLARVMILRGKLEAAEQLLLDTEPIAIQMNEVGFLPEIYMHLAEIATLENNRDQAASYAVKAAQIVTSDDLYSAPRSYCAAAMCLLDVDQGVQAAQYMDSAVRMVEESSFNFPYVKALVYFEYARFLARTDFQVAKIAQLCKEAKEMFLHLKARRDFERVVTFEKSVQNKP
jgi:Flp pilus assembly protein TadD